MVSLIRSSRPEPSGDPLDDPVLCFSEHDPFTIRDACEGIQIFGGIGSGKTSGSGALIAKAFLRAGFGGLVLTAKPDEPELWRKYAAETRRTSDLRFFSPNSGAAFNALDHEASRKGRGSGLTENLVELFSVLGTVAAKSAAKVGGENEAYWQNETKKLLRNAIDLLRLAALPISFLNLHQVILTAPTSLKEFGDRTWQSKSKCYDALLAATERFEARKLTASDNADFNVTYDYWTREFPTKSDRTRSTVLSYFSGAADPFLRGVLRELFSTGTNMRPEESSDGRIIILDLPQKLFNEVGVFAQVLFKYCWQRSVERRQVQVNSRPVFLWADESQFFVNEYDVAFQTTARSARVATVLLTQNLPNYHLALGGGRNAQPFVDSLLGNLATKIFHNNTCAQTNAYAAELFSKDWQDRDTSGFSQDEGRMTRSGSTSQSLEYVVPPVTFTTLAKGGPENNFAVEAIVHQGGKTFGLSGINALRTVFFQNHQT